jgi:hypothetical protein
MQLPRFVGFVDLGVLTVIAVLVILPPRGQYTKPVVKGDGFELALAEARTMADPNNGAAVDDLTHRLDDAQQKDWAIDFAVLASDRAKDSPTRWRALLAASTAFVDHVDLDSVRHGLDYINLALSACEVARDKNPSNCPTPDQLRMQLVQKSLKAGVDSGIDPAQDRRGFMRASEKDMLEIHLEHRDKDSTQTGSAGSGSAGSATAP